MGLIRSLDELSPDMRVRADDFLARAQVAGHRLYVFETKRSDAVQAAYCAQGRKPLSEVNTMRAACGLYALGYSDNLRKITDDPPAGLLTVYRDRGHGNGTAMDVVPVTAGGKLLWGAAPDVWKAIGEIGELCGLMWGGRFKPISLRTGLGWDPGHFQLPRPGETPGP
jgi:hypothetical protein